MGVHVVQAGEGHVGYEGPGGGLLEHVPHPAAGHDGELAGEGGHHEVADAQQLGVDDGRVPRVGPLHLTESNIKIKIN